MELLTCFIKETWMYIYNLCIIVNVIYFFSISLKKNIHEYHASWIIYCSMKEWMYFSLLRRKVISDPVFFVCFLLDNWEDRGRVDKAKDFRWRWGIEQEKRTGDYSRNPSNRDSQLKHRQLESVWGRGDSRGWWL